MRTYIRFLGSGALTLIGLGATIVVQGGWQAAAAGFGILAGSVFALSFIALRAGADRRRPGRPDWALAGGEPLGVPAATEAQPAGADVRGERAERAPRSPRRHPPAAAGGRSA